MQGRSVKGSNSGLLILYWLQFRGGQSRGQTAVSYNTLVMVQGRSKGSNSGLLLLVASSSYVLTDVTNVGVRLHIRSNPHAEFLALVPLADLGDLKLKNKKAAKNKTGIISYTMHY